MSRFPLLFFLSAAIAFSQTAQNAEMLRRYFEQGEAALAAGRYGDAEAAYEKLRQLDPGTAEVHAKLGMIFYQEGKFSSAIPVLRQAVKLKPALLNAAVLLAMSQSEIGRYAEALPGLEKGFRLIKDDALKRLAGLQLERTYTALKRDDRAVETALELGRLYPDDPEVLYHNGRLIGNFAFLTMEKLARVAPTSVWRYQAAGEAYESQGDLNLAILEYRKVLSADPNRPGIHYRLGRALLAQSRQPNSTADLSTEAAKEFEEEMRLDPTNANAAYELGEIDRKAGQLEKAREQFDAAVKQDAEFEDAQIGLGRTLAALGKPELALPHLEKAIAMNPRNEVPYYQLAQVFRLMGNTASQEKALADFRRIRASKAEQRASEVVPLREVTKQELDPKAEP